jgi:hypothetical protein
MAPEEAQQNAPRRRGRPPGSKTRNRRPRASGGDLVQQLNAAVAELIKKNRQLQRQVAKLSEKASKTPAGRGVERGLRTISRRVQKALGSQPASRRRATNGRRRKPATTRRRRAS